MSFSTIEDFIFINNYIVASGNPEFVVEILDFGHDFAVREPIICLRGDDVLKYY